MSVSVVTDEINPVSRWLSDSMPAKVREAVLLSVGAPQVKSSQYIFTPNWSRVGGELSVMVDNLDQPGKMVLVVNDETYPLTAHDAHRILEFWQQVVGAVKTDGVL